MLERMSHLGGQEAATLRGPRAALGRALLVLGLLLGVATGYLVVSGWQVAMVALGLLLALPTVIALHRYPFIAVLIWLALNQFLLTTEFLLPYRVAAWMFHRALPPLALGIIVLSAMLRIRRRPLPRLGLPELAMAGYLVASLISVVLLGYTPLATTYRIYDRIFVPMCLYLIVRLSAPGERDLARLAGVACFVCIAQMVIGLVSWLAPGILPLGWQGQVGQRTVGSLINTSTYTAALLFGALLLLHVGLNRERGAIRTLYLLVFAMSFLFVFLSFSRASWLGGLLVFVGVGLLYPAFVVRLGLLSVPIAIVVVSLGLLTHQLSWAGERLYSEESEGSALDRLPAYLAAVRMFQEKPLFGWGYENFDRYDRPFHDRVLDLANDNKDHANHSAYLTILAEQGAVGFALYLAVPLWWLARSVKMRGRLPTRGFWSRKLLVILWLVLLNIFVLNNFTPAWVDYGLGMWWMALGLIANMVDPPQPAVQPAPARPRTVEGWRLRA